MVLNLNYHGYKMEILEKQSQNVFLTKLRILLNVAQSGLLLVLCLINSLLYKRTFTGSTGCTGFTVHSRGGHVSLGSYVKYICNSGSIKNEP